MGCGPSKVKRRGSYDVDEPHLVIESDLKEVVMKNEHDFKSLNQYKVDILLGKGSFGSVYRAVDDRSEWVAIKVLDKALLTKKNRLKAADMLKGIMREIAIMKRLRHPCCIQLFEVIEDAAHNRLFLVMEYLEGGEVLSPRNLPSGESSLPAYVARSIFRDLVYGLEYLHQHGIIHRDIKPENLVYVDPPSFGERGSASRGLSITGVLPGLPRTSTVRSSVSVQSPGQTAVHKVPRVKLLDFGVSQMCEVHELDEESGNRRVKVDDSVLKSTGTPAFYAPEMMVKGAYHGKPADVWAAGVTLCMLLSGKLPFDADNMPEVFRRIKEDEPELPAVEDPLLEALLGTLLHKTPEQRPTATQLRGDGWLTSDGSEPLPDQAEVVEVTEEDISLAVTRLGAAMTVFKARSKFKALLVSSRLASTAHTDKHPSSPTSPRSRGPASPKKSESGATAAVFEALDDAVRSSEALQRKSLLAERPSAGAAAPPGASLAPELATVPSENAISEGRISISFDDDDELAASMAARAVAAALEMAAGGGELEASLAAAERI